MALAPSDFGDFQFGNSPFGGPAAVYGQNSGTYIWNPPISEIILEAYERCGMQGIELTSEKIQSARRSLNFVLSSWSNRGVNLWTVQQVIQYMPQGVTRYFDDASCVDILPDSMVIRQYQMGGPVSATPNFTTTQSSAVVTVAGLPYTPIIPGYISIVVPVSVGGIVLQGFYQVASVPGANQATITANAVATAAVANGGVVPSFSTAAGLATVAVNFPNHGLQGGQTFVVQEATYVGGLTLSGPYTVTSATVNSFTITAPSPAGFNDTESENSGNTILAAQSVANGLTFASDPVDILIYPLSRGDWQAIPDKFIQGRPTSVWIDKLTVPVINVWPVPDGNGPYELRYYRSRQVQDADVFGGQTLGVPYRFFETFAADLAAHLSIKWAPDRAKGLVQYAVEQWTIAADNDRERVSTFVVPDMSGYFG